MKSATRRLKNWIYNHKRQLTAFFTIGYLLAIAYITFMCRIPSILGQVAPYPFWAYSKALSGNWQSGLEIIENILLFVPLGYLLAQNEYKITTVTIIGFTISASIEIIQLVFHLGLFEFDDILNNTAGIFLGAIACNSFKISDVKRILIFGVVVICSIAYCFTIQEQEVEITKQKFFFGVESYSITDNAITLNGSCFIYEKPREGYSLILESTETTMLFSLSSNLPSEAIDEYYNCDEDYSNTGFVATAVIDPAQTYEIKVQWNNYIASETDVYIKNGEIFYSSEDEPDYAGKLLVSEPAHDFYVYQIDGDLYWLCGPNYPFNDDGSTYIQYHLYTTQIENLPSERLVNGWYWDNIGFNFENYEVEPYGIYRVAKRAIPTEYSVTTIATGYYQNGEWIWKDWFRPVVYYLPNFPLRKNMQQVEH